MRTIAWSARAVAVASRARCRDRRYKRPKQAPVESHSYKPSQLLQSQSTSVAMMKVLNWWSQFTASQREENNILMILAASASELPALWRY